MTDGKILKKAIDKATANGFQLDNHKHFCEIGRDTITGKILSLGAYQSIIFDHDFAKAFFGTEEVLISGKNKTDYILDWAENNHQNRTIEEARQIATKDWEYFKKIGSARPAYLYHLMDMALDTDTIKYLEKYL